MSDCQCQVDCYLSSAQKLFILNYYQNDRMTESTILNYIYLVTTSQINKLWEFPLNIFTWLQEKMTRKCLESNMWWMTTAKIPIEFFTL